LGALAGQHRTRGLLGHRRDVVDVLGADITKATAVAVALHRVPVFVTRVLDGQMEAAHGGRRNAGPSRAAYKLQILLYIIYLIGVFEVAACRRPAATARLRADDPELSRSSSRTDWSATR